VEDELQWLDIVTAMVVEGLPLVLLVM